MNRIAICGVLVIGNLVSSVSGQDQYLTGILIRTCSANLPKPMICTVAHAQSEMENLLKQAGWPLTYSRPLIDWQTDCAVIIAPGVRYRDYTLAFFDLTWTGREFALDWGWKPVKRLSRGGESITSGYEGSMVTQSEALIVVARRNVYPANSLTCYEKTARR